MFKKLLFIVSLLYSALFYSSAEVDYLKVKDIGDGGNINEEIIFKKAEGEVDTDGNVVYYEEVTKDEKTEKRIVIYLPSSLDDGRVEEAQKQFKNILNSGLIENGNFDLTYVDVPAGWDKTRQMPGIAARIDNSIQTKDGKNIETFPVLCATKRKNEFHGFFADEDGWKRSLGILANEDDSYQYNFYKKQMSISESPGYIAVEYGFYLSDIEHTERQLFYSMLHNNAILKNSTEIVLIGQKSQDEFWDVLDVNGHFASNDDEPSAPKFGFCHNSTFFVWTKGNPCISHRRWHDNGGICCTEWYKCVIYPALTNENSKIHGSKVFLYFNDESFGEPARSVCDKLWTCAGIESDRPDKLILASRVIGSEIGQLDSLIDCYRVELADEGSGKGKMGYRFQFESERFQELKDHVSLLSQKIPNLIVGKDAHIITKYDRAAIINRLNWWTNGKKGNLINNYDSAGDDTLIIKYINHYN